MTTTYAISGLQNISRQIFSNGEFVDSETVGINPATLTVTVDDARTTFSYSEAPDDLDELWTPVILDFVGDITADVEIDGEDVFALHAALEPIFQLSEFEWEDGTTILLNVYFDNFQGTQVPIVYDYTFFIDGPDPEVSTEEEYLELLADFLNLDPSTLSEAEIDALAEQVFDTPTGDFAPGAEISFDALNWTDVSDNPDDMGAVITGDDDDNDLDGTAGNDTIDGGRGDDEIDARAGDDDVRGGVGDDEIDGAGGNDVLRGGIGEDTIEGGDGNDTIRGQKNGDTLEGGDGDDNIKGGGGNDSLDGEDGNDFLTGGVRRDTLEGGDGNDTLIGNSFDDYLEGGDGNDRLNAGGDNDTLVGGEGDDTLKGGAGADVFEFEDDFGTDLIQDFVLGTDRLAIDATLLDPGEGPEDIWDTYGDTQDGTAILDFGDGNVITFAGQTDLSSIADDVLLV